MFQVGPLADGAPVQVEMLSALAQAAIVGRDIGGRQREM